MTAHPKAAVPVVERLDLTELAQRLDQLAARDQAPVEWIERANCRGIDPDLFFPERGGDTASPKAVCEGCQVRMECLAAALANREMFGVWGGLSERERRQVRQALSLGRRTRRGAAA